MVSRLDFISAALSSFLTALAPLPSWTPAPALRDKCFPNPAIPYDGSPLALKMPLLGGGEFDLQAYRGDLVLINVFATWCEPCKAEIPALVGLAGEYHSKGLRVIGVDSGEDDYTVRTFCRRMGVSYPVAMDRDLGFTQALEAGKNDYIAGFPVSLFVSPDGHLDCYRIGAMAEDELRYRIEKSLNSASRPSS